mmetsp:Transcript_18195/g.42125  ORF Transcript_18195/g.42125 Transcript_18195/m.42125 type:complete len:237 (-) Transcript_18195:220-930(-)
MKDRGGLKASQAHITVRSTGEAHAAPSPPPRSSRRRARGEEDCEKRRGRQGEKGTLDPRNAKPSDRGHHAPVFARVHDGQRDDHGGVQRVNQMWPMVADTLSKQAHHGESCEVSLPTKSIIFCRASRDFSSFLPRRLIMTRAWITVKTTSMPAHPNPNEKALWKSCWPGQAQRAMARIPSSHGPEARTATICIVLGSSLSACAMPTTGARSSNATYHPRAPHPTCAQLSPAPPTRG